MNIEIFRAESLNKTFGQEKVLKDVSFNVFEGETVVVVGANGAGKSTLMRILSGIIQKDSGRLYFKEKLIDAHNIKNAKELGIQVINDYSSVIDAYSVAENIFLAVKKRFVFNPKGLEKMAKPYMDTVGLKCPPHTLVSELSLSEKSKVQLAAALALNPSLLILDEPPLLHSDEDRQRLQKIFDDLKHNRCSIIYITHNLNDAMLFANRILVLRDGISASLTYKNDLTKEKLISILTKTSEKKENQVICPQALTSLEVRNIVSNKLNNINFYVRKGEILGLVGSLESGNGAVLDILFGLTPYKHGSILLDGKPVFIRKPSAAVHYGFSYSTEDKFNSTLLYNMTIKENLTLHSLKKVSRFGWINTSMERHFAHSHLKYLYNPHISIDTPIQHLSNGTQHKIQLAQCISSRPKYLLLYEPTNGMDLLSKQETLTTIIALAKSGVTVLIAASIESYDILTVCNRLLIFKNGLIKGELNRGEVTRGNILSIEQR